ncbi:MAG: carbamoyltransferase HypF [Desulfobulbaceae bacterium]|nr:carbamoyltransferase HypF [Desulfobulbaceae bacterium]
MVFGPEAGAGAVSRWKIAINGVVQGVGFRPFVYNLACRYSLVGFVANTSMGVEIEAQGGLEHLAAFAAALRDQAPPQAEIFSLRSSSMAATAETDFQIHHSQVTGPSNTLIAPDLALCLDCLRELLDPADRRYLYPFINCTNCGPRYSIVTAIPYDRPATAMRYFPMCADCRREYDDPSDRRFHAQPVACPACGPRVWLVDATGFAVAEASTAIRQGGELLRRGEILAVKGLAGFHLAVDASSELAVSRLRQRKGREEKPLAVMVSALTAARVLARLSGEDEALLASPAAPIVLAPASPGNGLTQAVARDSARVGVMLAYTPLQHLLLREFGGPLVMTSGNRSEEPICIDNAEALSRLAGIADGFLLHDRDIYVRGDDSVVMRMAGRVRRLRRSRGYVPRPVMVAPDGPPVLAVGGELKNAICLLKGERAFLGQHLGDLKNLPAYDFFRENLVHLEKIFVAEPQLVVHDLHPDYLSTRWARDEQCLPTLAVQHHHAHLAAVLAEHLAAGPAIGIILDGSGYGWDRTIWGGEILVGDYRNCRRLGSFEPLPLPGGDAAVKAPWRTGLGYLHAACGGRIPELPFLRGRPVGAVTELLVRELNCPQTSSCGRLFDAVAALCDLRSEISYEAQAAIALMEAAGGRLGEPYEWGLYEEGDIFRLALQPLIRQIAEEVGGGAEPAAVSCRLHGTLVAMLTGAAERAREESGLNLVALSGGVFNNYLLLEGLLAALTGKGFAVLSHEQVPFGDGGLALGQALIGRQYLLDRVAN